jgi:hypothetical protein
MYPSQNWQNNLAVLVEHIAVNAPALSQRLNSLFSSPALTPERELRIFLRRHRKLIAAQALQILISNPGVSYTAANLQDLIHSKNNPTAKTSAKESPRPNEPYLLEKPIPYCDSQAVSEVLHRIRQIQSKLRAQDLSSEQNQALTAELEALQKYLSDCLIPGGSIRSFDSVTQKTAKYLTSAFHRLFAIARKENPALHSHILEHLQTGKTCCWRE